jgi:hypothetical protein
MQRRRLLVFPLFLFVAFQKEKGTYGHGALLGRAKVLALDADANRAAGAANDRSLSVLAVELGSVLVVDSLGHGGGEADEDRGENELRLHIEKWKKL